MADNKKDSQDEISLSDVPDKDLDKLQGSLDKRKSEADEKFESERAKKAKKFIEDDAKHMAALRAKNNGTTEKPKLTEKNKQVDFNKAVLYLLNKI